MSYRGARQHDNTSRGYSSGPQKRPRENRFKTNQSSSNYHHKHNSNTNNDGDDDDNDDDDTPRTQLTYPQLVKSLADSDKKMRIQATSALKNAAKICDLKHYNRLILDLGNTRNMYGYAKKAYTDLLSTPRLKPNEYTYANILNAASRASSKDDLTLYLNDMKKYGINMDDVIYTILTKFHCSMGDVKEAINVLDTMIKDDIIPNMRTYNTILRECMHQSDLTSALVVLSYMEKTNIPLSSNGIEFICRIYAQQFDIPKAMERFNVLYEQYRTTGANAEDTMNPIELSVLPYATASAGVSIAKSCIALNDIKTGRRVLLQAKDIVDILSKNTTVQWWKLKRGVRTHHTEEKTQADVDRENNRVAFSHDKEYTSTQFLKTRLNDLSYDIRYIEGWMATQAHFQNITPLNLVKSEKIASFQWKATGTTPQGLSLQHRVIQIAHHPHTKSSNDNLFDHNTNFIDFGRLFRNTNPIRVEAGSGNGDWICLRAKNEPDINWVAIEFTPQRVHQIYTRMLLNNVSNLVIIQGDAFYALEHYFAPKSIQHLFVNFPEPPWWAQWTYKLLNHKFFNLAFEKLMKSKKVLKDKGQDFLIDPYGTNGQGILTILTDDQHYTHILLRELFHETNGQSRNMFIPYLTPVIDPIAEANKHADGTSTTATSNTDNDERKFALGLPAEYGTSYFDKFWKQGKKYRRFYFKLGKNSDYKLGTNESLDSTTTTTTTAYDSSKTSSSSSSSSPEHDVSNTKSSSKNNKTVVKADEVKTPLVVDDDEPKSKKSRSGKSLKHQDTDSNDHDNQLVSLVSKSTKVPEDESDDVAPKEKKDKKEKKEKKEKKSKKD